MSADATAKRTSTSTTTASTRAPSKRVSTIPAPPKPPTQIDPTAIIANHAQLVGLHTITLGARSVVHPHAKLLSAEAGVRIGDGCVIWEKGVVGAEPLPQASQDGEANEAEDAKRETVLGDNVVLESCAIVEEGAQVGEGSIVESYARICARATLGRGCKVQSFAVVRAGMVADQTVVLSDGRRRLDRSVEAVRGGKEVAHEKMVRDFGRVVPANNVKWT